MSRITTTRSRQYRLTQRRLVRTLAEANYLIARLLDRGITPDMTLRPVRENAFARYVGCHRFRDSR